MVAQKLTKTKKNFITEISLVATNAFCKLKHSLN